MWLKELKIYFAHLHFEENIFFENYLEYGPLDVLFDKIDMVYFVNSHFHFSEQLFFKDLDSTCAKKYFFNAWALKEAALKSAGEGITFGGLSKLVVGLKNKSYIIKEGLKEDKAIVGSITLKRNDTELVIGVSVY